MKLYIYIYFSYFILKIYLFKYIFDEQKKKKK